MRLACIVLTVSQALVMTHRCTILCLHECRRARALEMRQLLDDASAYGKVALQWLIIICMVFAGYALRNQ